MPKQHSQYTGRRLPTMAGNGSSNGGSRYLDSWIKRCFDVATCLVLLPPAMMLMGWAGVAILIKEGRPVLFVQKRVGKGGELFKMPKLRTLYRDTAPYKSKTEYDLKAHVTPTGSVLRRYKLDELPQLFAVLTGRMSLVGPRPELPGIVAGYSAFEKKRLLMKPGITGLWQVLADHEAPIHHNLKYDLYYFRKATIWLDVKLLFLTIRFVLKPT